MNDPAKPSAPTSAHALHDILRNVKDKNAATLAEAWSQVLGAKWGSLSFAERAAEVVYLWREMLIQINSLPERTRQRLRSYALASWSAVMPNSSWESAHPTTAITDAHLDELANTGDLIASNLPRTAMAPGSENLTGLRAQCEEWILVLAERAEIPDDALRGELLCQMRHLVWLIDNADKFGVSRVAQHADQVTGTLMRTYVRSDLGNAQSGFIRRTGNFVLALAAVTGLLTSAGTAVEAANKDLLSIEQLAHDIAHSPVTPSQHDPGPLTDRHDPAR